MKTTRILRMAKSCLAALGALAALAPAALSAQADDRAAIETLLAAYETALNASDADSVLLLYAPDGVFMAQHSPPHIGAQAVRAAYDGVFETIALDIDFTIDEIVQTAPAWAFARTRSEGFVTVNASGERSPEANQEIFILTKTDDGQWKITHYIFSTTNPPRL